MTSTTDPLAAVTLHAHTLADATSAAAHTLAVYLERAELAARQERAARRKAPPVLIALSASDLDDLRTTIDALRSAAAEWLSAARLIA